jgi:predicted metalloprotease
MIWKGRRQSGNVEDRRGTSGKGVALGGIGTLVLALAIYFLGGDPTAILNTVQDSQVNTASYEGTAEENELAEFVSVVLADTEDVWSNLFSRKGSQYNMPGLVIYSGSVESACGRGSRSTGPFYCPGDNKVYIDLSFYNELRDRFKASGDFAMAYVIAHEVGHHVQKLTGTMRKVDSLRGRVSETEYNRFLVRLELQADYYAGVWAHYAQKMKVLEEGDLEEAMNAASAVGDDRIQKNARGYVVPDSFTHGTSEQRARWFMKGYKSGTIEDGDTFSAEEL